jgi:hypothetical protein
LVADLVSPGTEASTGVDVLGLELWKELLENTLTLKGWGWVTVVETTVVSGDNLVGWLDHLSVDKTLDGVSEDVGLVNWLHGRLGNLQHDGPVWTLLGLGGSWLVTVGEVLSWKLNILLWLVVWGVVGEDGCSVEWAVVFWEVELDRSVFDAVGRGS